MFMSKTNRQVAETAGRRPPRKLMVVGAFVACVLGTSATQTARATPPSGFTATNIVGPVGLDEIHTLIETPGYGAMIKTRGQSDVYITHLKIEPGGTAAGTRTPVRRSSRSIPARHRSMTNATTSHRTRTPRTPDSSRTPGACTSWRMKEWSI